ncbi:MAG: cytochrome P450 [Burkholderiales bacterium]|nr:cytochrome P450 [Burkholderiales bacterium]
MPAVVDHDLDPREVGNALVSARTFADLPRIHALFARLREHGRPLWVTPDNTRPFWAVTRHAQIVEASASNEVFISSRRLNLMSRLQEAAAFKGGERYGAVLRTLVHMDEPDHRKYRAVAQPWFNALAVRQQLGALEELAREFAAKFGTAPEGTLDFGAEVATYFPLRVIMSILGIPLEDMPLMHRLTKQLSAPHDPDFSDDIERGDHMFDSIPEFTDYFLKVIEDRRRHPRDDVASVIANGSIDGAPLGELEAVSYFITMAVAGHDTTAAAMAGGCQALAERPEAWARLKREPGLLKTAAEEMIRWVTPIKHFMRTAARDTALGGQAIRAGEAIAMFYLAANFDPEVFDAPHAFRIDRSPNRQIAFGHGPHVCMGMVLSRLELTTWFAEMLRRVDTLEMAGPVRLLESNFLGGYKSVPIRYRLAA